MGKFGKHGRRTDGIGKSGRRHIQNSNRESNADVIELFSRVTRSLPSNDSGLFGVRCKRAALTPCSSLFAVIASVAVAQGDAQNQSPIITLYLPPDVASETVQISYFMLGSFGGYGGPVSTEKGRVLYDIPTSVDGKPAEVVKIIAYLPGCEIAKLEIAMQGASEARTLACRPLGRVPLHERISPLSNAQTAKIEVEATYLAEWDHEFFGVTDGPVTNIHIATTTPDEEGHFEVELPDFFSQAELGVGSFQFLLRDSTSGNIIATLKPVNMAKYFNGLAVRSSYEPFVEFSADASVSKPQTDPGLIKDGRDH